VVEEDWNQAEQNSQFLQHQFPITLINQSIDQRYSRRGNQCQWEPKPETINCNQWETRYLGIQREY
jgi:alpha-galactosidase